MRLLSRSSVIVTRRKVLILLSAENDRSEVALVAGMTSKSFMAVNTAENATLCAHDNPPSTSAKYATVGSTRELFEQRACNRGSWVFAAVPC